jgi:hypothetical protein
MGYKNQPRATPPSTQPDKDVMMKQYQILVDTYKTYLDLILKFILFSYAVTGGILSFYLSQRNEGIIKAGLVFPVIMNSAFAALSFLAAGRVKPLSEEVERVTNALDLLATPDIDFLAFALRLLGVLFIIVACGLVVITFLR